MNYFDPTYLRASGFNSNPFAAIPGGITLASHGANNPGGLSTQEYAQLQGYQNRYDTVGNFLSQQQQSNPAAYNMFRQNPYALPTDLSKYSLPAPQLAPKSTTSPIATATTKPAAPKQATTLFKTRTTGAGTPFPSTDPNVFLNELQNTYGQLDTIFDPTQIQNAYKNIIDLDTALGLQTANAAANEAAARGFQSGNMQNTGLLRAQALLPVYQHTGELNTQLQNQLTDLSKAKATTSAQVASTLGQLRNQYAGSLADYTAQLSGIQSTRANEQANLEERQREFDVSSKSDAARLAQQSYEFNAGHSLDLAKLMLAQRQAQAQQISNSPYLNDFTTRAGEVVGGNHDTDWRYNATARSQLLQQLLGANII